jgi:hypothetical protein
MGVAMWGLASVSSRLIEPGPAATNTGINQRGLATVSRKLMELGQQEEKTR